MAGNERRDRKISQRPASQQPRLIEVTRFAGVQLQEIDSKVGTYLDTHDGAVEEEVIEALADNERAARRLRLGLDVMRELSAAGRTVRDARLVIVHQEQTPANTQPNPDSRPQYSFSIDWINPPAPKPAPRPKPAPFQPPSFSPRTPRPEQSLPQRTLKVDRRARKREEREEKMQMEKEGKK